MESQTAWIFQIMMGIGLAACAGLRVFLPLLVVGIAGRLEWIPLAGPFEWLSGWPAMIVFGVAVVVEILADKIPLVDNILDMVHGLVKPIAGAILMASVVTELTPLQTTVLAIILGGGTAGTVQLTKAKIRLVSSTTTAGAGNPVISVAEDAGSLAGSVIALIAPVLIVLALAAGAAILFIVTRRLKARAGT